MEQILLQVILPIIVKIQLVQMQIVYYVIIMQVIVNYVNLNLNKLEEHVLHVMYNIAKFVTVTLILVINV